MKLNQVLSIQSHVVYGHAGNSSAVFPMQRLGINVLPLYTVQFSNHTGYGDWKGEIFSAQSIENCIEGLKDRAVFSQLDALLSGYLGSSDTAKVIAQTAKALKKENPNSIYCADPILGDFGRGVYVNPELPEIVKEYILPIADILLPNHFEAELLTGLKIETTQDAIAASEKLMSLGIDIVVITSLQRKEALCNTIECLVATKKEAFIYTTSKVDLKKDPVGTGDLFSSIFLSNYLLDKDIKKALIHAASAVKNILDETKKCNKWELQLIANQDKILSPTCEYSLEKIY